MLKQQSKESPDTSISVLAASIASKLARNAAPPGDPPYTGASVLSEDSFSVDNQRRDEVPALQEIASEMACPYPLRTNRTAEEYRGRADECLNWAREAPADEVEPSGTAMVPSATRSAAPANRKFIRAPKRRRCDGTRLRRRTPCVLIGVSLAKGPGVGSKRSRWWGPGPRWCRSRNRWLRRWPGRRRSQWSHRERTTNR